MTSPPHRAKLARGRPTLCRWSTRRMGPPAGKLALDLQDIDFKAALGVACSDGPALEGRQAFGKLLYDALFSGEVRDAWVASLEAAKQADGLRLCLWINAPQVAALPWELLWHEDRGFLATAGDLTVSRYLPVPEPPLLATQDRLHILVVVESPTHKPVTSDEVARLEAALTALRDSGMPVEHRVLRNVTLPQIKQALLQQEYHVLHFLGHGEPGKLLLIKDDQQTAAPIGDQEFAELFLGRRSLRLVVLTACSSSQVVDGSLFSGIGPALVQKRVPAVVAMQYPSVYQDTASQFSQAFYGALAGGRPVDVAVNEARNTLSAGSLLPGRDLEHAGALHGYT